MRVGYNHNIRYKGLLFHVQTEDGGQNNPVVTTHIFYQGNVVTSRKCNYRHLLYDDNRDQAVTKMMQEQHKATMKSLVKGELDELESLKKILPKEEKKETVKSSVYQIYNPEDKKEKLDIKSDSEEKSLDEMILEYLSESKDD